MLKKAILGTVIFMMVLVSTSFAGECDGEKGYSYRNGHTSIIKSYYLEKEFAKNVKIYPIDIGYFWKKSVKNAIKRLNSELTGTKSYLRFSLNDFSNIDDDCYSYVSMSDSLPSGRLGQAHNLAQIGSMGIYISSDIKSITTAEAESMLMHEILHTVGLGHTGQKMKNWIEIPNTDGYFDAKYAGRSMMCTTSTRGRYAQRHLNFLDKRSIEFMYSD